VSDQANVLHPDFDASTDRPGFNSRRAQVGRQAGAHRLGASLFDLEAGSAPFPLHYHLANEELLIVFGGRPSLRTADGERLLDEGEIVAFPRGESGAHQVVNRSEEPVRVLIISEMNAPDIVVRPESGKLSAFGRPPGGRGEGMHKVFFLRDEADFWEGEEPPPPG
jgi:uncharacterized cupin superfamily protein